MGRDVGAAAAVAAAGGADGPRGGGLSQDARGEVLLKKGILIKITFFQIYARSMSPAHSLSRAASSPLPC